MYSKSIIPQVGDKLIAMYVIALFLQKESHCYSWIPVVVFNSSFLYAQSYLIFFILALFVNLDYGSMINV